MPQTRATVVDNLVSLLQSVPGMRRATALHEPPDKQWANAPYVGVIVASEERRVDDGTDILWLARIELLLVAKNENLDYMIDGCKEKLLDHAEDQIGAKYVGLSTIEKTHLLEFQEYGSARLGLDVYYLSQRGDI